MWWSKNTISASSTENCLRIILRYSTWVKFTLHHWILCVYIPRWALSETISLLSQPLRPVVREKQTSSMWTDVSLIFTVTVMLKSSCFRRNYLSFHSCRLPQTSQVNVWPHRYLKEQTEVNWSQDSQLCDYVDSTKICTALTSADNIIEALTNERYALAVDDSTGEKVEIIFLAIHYHCVTGIVTPLQIRIGTARGVWANSDSFTCCIAGSQRAEVGSSQGVLNLS